MLGPLCMSCHSKQRLEQIHCKTSTVRVEGQVLDHERERNPFALCVFQKSWLGLLDFLIVVVFIEVYYFCYKKLEQRII